MAEYYYYDYNLNLASQTCVVASPWLRRADGGSSAQTEKQIQRLFVAHKRNKLGLSRSARLPADAALHTQPNSGPLQEVNQLPQTKHCEGLRSHKACAWEGCTESTGRRVLATSL